MRAGRVKPEQEGDCGHTARSVTLSPLNWDRILGWWTGGLVGWWAGGGLWVIARLVGWWWVIARLVLGASGLTAHTTCWNVNVGPEFTQLPQPGMKVWSVKVWRVAAPVAAAPLLHTEPQSTSRVYSQPVTLLNNHQPTKNLL